MSAKFEYKNWLFPLIVIKKKCVYFIHLCFIWMREMKGIDLENSNFSFIYRLLFIEYILLNWKSKEREKNDFFTRYEKKIDLKY